MRELRALDLFCGACGGWSVGLHENGIETAAACEIDSWRRETFSKNFPRARMYDDVRSLTATRLLDDLGFLPEVIVGSPPCQDASTANTQGKGVDGERTGLFFDAVRLVSEVRPVWACFENVPGLRARGYDRVHTALEEIGYSVRPLVVGAWHAGAPHRRNRVWVVAYPRQCQRSADVRQGRAFTALGATADSLTQRADDLVVAVAPQEQMGRAGQPRREVGRHAHTDADEARLEKRPSIGSNVCPQLPDGFDASDVADASGADAAGRSEDGGRLGWSSALAEWSHWNGGPPDLGRVDDGLPKGMARKSLSAYGDAVVPRITSAVIRSIQSAFLQQREREAA